MQRRRVALTRPCGVTDTAALRAQASRLDQGLHPSRATAYKTVPVLWELDVHSDWLDWNGMANPSRIAVACET
eukprot:4361499-Amphidinium_carterae.1